MATDDVHIIVSGRMRTIEYAVLQDGTMPAKGFCDLLDRRDWDRLFSLFLHIANNGEGGIPRERFTSEAKFPSDINKGDGKLHAFKDTTHRRPGGGKGMFRIACFRQQNRWILLRGFWKPPQSKWPLTEIEESFAVVREVLALEKHRKHNRS